MFCVGWNLISGAECKEQKSIAIPRNGWKYNIEYHKGLY